jgi:hypothetical protein
VYDHRAAFAIKNVKSSGGNGTMNHETVVADSVYTTPNVRTYKMVFFGLSGSNMKIPTDRSLWFDICAIVEDYGNVKKNHLTSSQFWR